MTEMFYMVLNMSIAASIAIAAVFVLRLLLKGAPRIFSYVLWIVVFARLLCPFVPESDWGIIPGADIAEFWEKNASGKEPEDIQVAEENSFSSLPYAEAGGNQSEQSMEVEPSKAAGIEKSAIKGTEIQTAGTGETIRNFFAGERKVVQSLAVLWLAVCVSLLLYGMISYRRFMKSLKTCGKGTEAIIISEDVKAPFVAGFFKPVIYLPGGLGKDQLDMVCAHEKMHIIRRDYLIKPVAFLATCIHWFNPLVWLAFFYMEKDMEISCDEAVLGRIGYEKNKIYAGTLLYLSQEHGWKPGCPIAFGENSVKVRIKNAVRYKHAKTWIVAVSAAVVLAAAVLLFVNSKWRLVISLEEKGAVENMTMDSNADSGQGIPGIDSNIGMDEIIYLPEEKIVHSEIIPEGESEGVDMTHYFNSAEVGSGSGNMPASEEELGSEDKPAGEGAPESSDEPAVENQSEQIGAGREQVSDNYAALLRQSEGAHDMTEIKYACPLEYERISDGFGVRLNPVTQQERVHSGIDFAAAAGTPVKAAAAGIVFETGEDVACGNYVIIQHSNGDMTYYANCGEILVEAGTGVEMGTQIATVGNTGYSTGAHLHYALSREGVYVNPEFFY